MFARIRAYVSTRTAPIAVLSQRDEAPADPVREFAMFAMERAEGICWVRHEGGLDEVFGAIAEDLPELGRSSLRWSGAGTLQDSDVEWYAFEGGGSAALVFTMAAPKALPLRQLGVLRALSDHGAFVIAGGTAPAQLLGDLRDMHGVPAWDVCGQGRPALAA